MGRFDALTTLDEKQQELKPPATPSPIPSSQKEENKEVKKPANPQAGKTANPLTRKPARLKTRKPSSQQKGLLLSKNL